MRFRGASAVQNLTSILREVSGWPPEQRRALATSLLQSLQPDEKPMPVAPDQQEALRQLIGIWKTEQPPTDDEVEQILEQERMKKYG
jgi:hypothetical protein